MSPHDFGLLSVHPINDHFPSAFMHGYHHPSHYDRFPSGTGFDRHFHSDSTPRESYHLDRRLSEPLPVLRPASALQRQSSISSISTHFDYPSTALSQSTGLRRESALVTGEPTALRPIVEFDPRPPHAGWTPKEEVVDEEVHSGELLSSSGLADPRSPGDMRSGYLSNPPIPRDDSLSPTSGQPSSPNSASKTYSFVSLPGNAIRKRPRRRYDEIERLYACSWPECTKAYGTLNHLNAHVSMQRHGPKRSPAEFKELRKQWRQQKKQVSLTGPIRGVDMDPFLRRRRATEPNLLMGRNSLLPMGSNQYQIGMSNRLLSTDLHYTQTLDEENLSVSPTSTASDNVSFWQDQSVTSPIDQQQRANLVYSMRMPHSESPVPPPLSPHDLVAAPSMSRLPPDSTLLTPIQGYRPPSPHNLMSMSPTMNRLPPDSTLLTSLSAYRTSPNHNMVQSLATTNMQSLSPSHQPQGFDEEYQGTR